MRRREFFAALSGLLAVAACGDGAGPGSAPAEPPPPPPPPPGGPVPGANVTVNIEDNAFVDPSGGRNGDAQVTIRSGETVGWRHVGANPHTVTSTDVPSGARAFDSGTLGSNETFTVTPSVPGTYVYYCATHPSIMVGARIVVT
ncbi:cupredoxin domain-containing protein [Candidatus Palauibacter sp.]|uniref:cupredoxin domain-containing protein n=1 Tax=Candidatus Palauibacter sp. TaxID=3101350 RepID=UPI003D0F48FE